MQKYCFVSVRLFKYDWECFGFSIDMYALLWKRVNILGRPRLNRQIYTQMLNKEPINVEKQCVFYCTVKKGMVTWYIQSGVKKKKDKKSSINENILISYNPTRQRSEKASWMIASWTFDFSENCSFVWKSISGDDYNLII